MDELVEVSVESQSMIDGSAYSEQALGPFDDAHTCRSVGGERASIGPKERPSPSETLEGLIDRLDTTGPIEVRGFGGVSKGVLHAVEDDPANTVGVH